RRRVLSVRTTGICGENQDAVSGDAARAGARSKVEIRTAKRESGGDSFGSPERPHQLQTTLLAGRSDSWPRRSRGPCRTCYRYFERAQPQGYAPTQSGSYPAERWNFATGGTLAPLRTGA